MVDSLRAATAMSSQASSLAMSTVRHLGQSSESSMVRTFQHATLRFAVFFFLFFFLPLGRDACWPQLANQVGVWQALFRPPFLGPSPSGASSPVPKEGCMVTQSAAKCCCCLRPTDKRPIQLSRLHAELRLLVIVWQLQSLRTSGSRWRPYYRKPWLQMLACKPKNTKTGLMKQIRKSKSSLKRNPPATIICLQNLMIKLPRLHTRLPAVNSWLSLRPCRMIGGQDLPRGHNRMLTWVMRAFDEALKAVYGHQIQAPLHSSDWSTLLTDTDAILQCWSEHSEGLFSDWRTVQGLHQPRFPKWTWSWTWMAHPLMKRSGKPQCSWRWASHLALMAFQQKSISIGEKQCLIS